MISNSFQYAFIGVMFCIICVWVTFFLGNEEPAIEIKVTKPNGAICSCTNSPMFLKVDSLGIIRYKNQIVSMDDVVNTVAILRNDGWLYGVVITASSDAEHQNIFALTSRLKEQAEGINVVWRSNEI